MSTFIDIKSIREGIYLLWSAGAVDKARQLTDSNIPEIRDKLNSLDLREMNKIKNEFISSTTPIYDIQKKYRNNAINEHQLEWIDESHNACLFFWLHLYLEHTHGDIEDYEDCLYTKRRSGAVKINRFHMPINTPDAVWQFRASSLFILDALPYDLHRKNEIINEIKNKYFKTADNIDKDFKWFSDAKPKYVEMIWEQFSNKREYRRSTMRQLEFIRAMRGKLIPVIFHSLDTEEDSKTLFLSTLRKRYANWKHREKVSDKAPVNIRISPKAKKNLERLEKRMNRNRADVIEYLIETKWAELNQKN